MITGTFGRAAFTLGNIWHRCRRGAASRCRLCGGHGGPIRNSAMATETANTTATRAVVFHPSSSVGFPHPRQRDGGGRNDVGVADLVDGRNDGRWRRECLVFMSQLPNGGGGAQARRPERRDFKRQGFDQPRIARIGAERSAHHAHSSHNIAEKCEPSSMRVIIPMIYSTNSVHRVGAGITARVVWGISATGQTRKSGRGEVISGLPK